MIMDELYVKSDYGIQNIFPLDSYCSSPHPSDLISAMTGSLYFPSHVPSSGLSCSILVSPCLNSPLGCKLLKGRAMARPWYILII